MKMVLTAVLALAAIAALPVSAVAATYQYVASSGDVLTTSAPNAETAIITAPGIAPTSGVLLISESDDMLPTGMDVPIDPTPPVTP